MRPEKVVSLTCDAPFMELVAFESKFSTWPVKSVVVVLNYLTAKTARTRRQAQSY